ncbi:MAG: urate oxidase [Spirochaetes bacterium]|jgi:urate oxidase|nr:urate oxidase [Spirochaetota bacterium]
MAVLRDNSYGKERVRLTKIVRDESGGSTPPVHHVYEYTVEIMLHGAFDRVYTDADNSACVPTDTMKNTVYAVARTSTFSSPEQFADALSGRFIDRFEQVEGVDIELEAQRWRRIEVDGAQHPHAFEKQHGTRTAVISRRGADAASSQSALSGGIRGMEVFKSTGSGFTGFYHDEYTTLPETEDRILATTVDAEWDYGAGVDMAGTDFDSVWETIHHTVARVFAKHDSPSLQATLWEMGTAVIGEVPVVDSISFSMPNQHHIRFDLSAFGLDNPNEVFYGTDSPFGIITGTVDREEET